MNHQAQPRYLSRGIDYLNDIGAKLRDLKGFNTLAHELIQNAEDSEGVTWMSFDIRNDALVVDNDGVFSDCGQAEEPSCPWRQTKGHMCDFHRFRVVGSGDKREEEGKKGAFGIGFIAVYQITDRPELLSAGRHWIVHEVKTEHERIEVCHGCPKCSEQNLPGTRFILPWAKDQSSALRKSLKVEAVSDGDINEMLRELISTIPTSMIFLDHIKKIDIKKNGEIIKSLERDKDHDDLIITDGNPENDRIWHLFFGDFESEAARLRDRHPGRIENKRSAKVTIAIPAEPRDSGLFCAFLPTRRDIGIPFHINADFFTTNDRKGIILEKDFQSEWNRAAISAAAAAFIDNILGIRDRIGHEHLWMIIEAAARIHNEALKGLRDQSLQDFWDKLHPEFPKLKIIYSTQHRWEYPSEVLLLEKNEEEKAVPILENLNIAIVNSDLRPFFGLLRREEIGVQLLDLHHIADSLERMGLTQRVERSQFPEWLQSEAALHALWHELGVLQERRQNPEKKKEAERRFQRLAIAIGRDQALWPCGQVYQADAETIMLFEAIDATIPFLAELGEEGRFLKSICPPFSPAVAIDRLGLVGQDRLNAAWAEGRLKPADLLGWLASHRQEILSSDKLRQKLSLLPIFPTTSELRPLPTLGLPGDFEDPLGLTDVIDLQQLGGRRDFLKDLGAKELTFISYARDHIPRAFRDPKTTFDKKQKALRLLAEHRGKITGDPLIRQSLMEVEIVECEDGIFRKPWEVYFRNNSVIEVLGEEVNFALIPQDQEAARREFYKWLEVAEFPRDLDILARVKQLTIKPPQIESRDAIQIIFKHLSEKQDISEAEELSELRTIQWLPAVNMNAQWYRPQDLYTRSIAHLLETQAHFLDVPPAYQTENILNFLGIKTRPEVPMVVSHLLKCAKLKKEVHKEVYRFLNENYRHPNIAEKLGTARCLLLSDGSYVRPDQVFWGDHPFGRFRYRLDSELRMYNNLFAVLGVREGPDYKDAIEVIKEISSKYGTTNSRLTEEDHAVLLRCWQMLEQALENETIDAAALEPLKNRKVIPNRERLLLCPEHIIFEDRAGLAAKFNGFLEQHVISRPQGAWKAMTAVGVRLLSSAVESHLKECIDPLRDELVADRICERRLQLERALNSMLGDTGLKENWDVIEELSCFAVRDLSIYFSVSLFGRERHSLPESVPAHFQRQESCLYFVRGESHLPWPSIARELATALCPEAEPGRLATGIKDVLSAESEAEARALLDELGFPPLEQGPEGKTTVASEGVKLGGIEEEIEVIPTVSASGQAAATETKTEAAPPESDAMPPAETRSGLETMEGIASLGRRSSVPGPQRKATKSRLRTYLVPPGQETEEIEEEPERRVQREKIDRCGMAKVLAYERETGRTPQDMGPTHEGYDIESKNDGGEIERYIEVKSLSGSWEPMGVLLTKPQFEKARELGEKYWLYVVELADSDDFCIRRINDPAGQANEFRYDDGWRALAEEENDDQK